jgi:phage gp46-like protein
MTDIRLIFDNTTGMCDWVLTDGDLDTSEDLETAVLMSLFEDAQAPDGTIPPDGSTDLRGCWIDGMEGHSGGSQLWTIEGAKKTPGLLTHAQRICEQALQWMVTAGIVGTVTVTTSWLNGTTLNIGISLAMPDGTTRSFAYAWAWKDQNALPAANSY